MFRAYYQLTKPGIIYGNCMTAAAGFLLASQGHIDLWLLLAVLAGTALVIASGCVYNNYIDRGIDAKMARTKNRALVTGAISGSHALAYATVLGMLGFLILVLYTNPLTVMVGAVGFFVYVVAYGISKRRSTLGTIIGSIAGATPITAGYTAAANDFDSGALLLFLILALWQMPHFYAIATYRRTDYAAAGLPVLPVKKSAYVTKVNILLYVAAFITAALLLTFYGHTGYVYALVVSFIGLGWLHIAWQGFGAADNVAWARRMFGFSLVVLLVFSFMISIDHLLP